MLQISQGERELACTRIFCQSTLRALDRCGVKVRLRQPSPGQEAGGVYLPSGKLTLALQPHLAHVKSIPVTSGRMALMRTTVPRTVTSLPEQAAGDTGALVRLVRSGLVSWRTTRGPSWQSRMPGCVHTYRAGLEHPDLDYGRSMVDDASCHLCWLGIRSEKVFGFLAMPLEEGL